MILMIDNYDSFTYNLVQYLAELGAQVEVRRNDAIGLDEVAQLDPELIVISPGPGRPERAGVTVELIRRFAGKVPIFGVCLGHQAIAFALGGRIVQANRIMHGKTSPIHHDGGGIFQKLPSPFEATRYHSLIVERQGFPGALEVSAETQEGEVMGLRGKGTPLEGVQFHPESILTREGKALLQNVLAMARKS
jgi:anthranilate synthase/aminodeoxychorismate synthase-like glutamine amidotransferase